eukprot:scaffold585749_cov18-Prasinocladus_malaysianus.AAC.1
MRPSRGVPRARPRELPLLPVKLAMRADPRNAGHLRRRNSEGRLVKLSVQTTGKYADALAR